MAEKAGPSTTGGDQGPKEEQLSLQQPSGDVEMEDLPSTQSKPANPDSNPDGPAAVPSTPSPVSPQTNDAAGPATAAEIPSPSPVTDADADVDAEAKAPAPKSTVAPSGGETSTTTKAQGKAPENTDDLTIDPVEPETSADGGEMAVEIMLLLTTGARHPFRIDEKYLTKRNVAVTGKTEDGKMDPSSITVYTLKELILRDWRKEWDQPPREPSAIRLIHFGRMLEDRMPLNRK